MSEHLGGASLTPYVTAMFQDPDLDLPSRHPYIPQTTWARDEVNNPFTITVSHTS